MNRRLFLKISALPFAAAAMTTIGAIPKPVSASKNTKSQYMEGMTIRFIPENTNTGATININNHGTALITKRTKKSFTYSID